MALEPPYEQLCRELVRLLRGERSQPGLCRRLRYESNVVYHWEAGRRYPSPASFFWLVHRTGGPVDTAVRCLVGADPLSEPPWTVVGSAELLTRLIGKRSATSIAKVVGSSRHTVGRWLRGETETRLPVFLKIVQHCTGDLLQFLATIAPPEQLPSVAALWAQRGAAQRLISEVPWTPALLLALELSAYRAMPCHEHGWLAARVGLSPEQEERGLRLLVAAGQIRYDGVKYEQIQEPAVDMGGTGKRVELRSFWTTEATTRAVDNHDAKVAWRLMTCSEEQLQRLIALQRQMYRDMHAILQEPAEPERVVLASSAMVPLDVPSV